MEQFVVSAIKYRPLSFSSVVGQSSIGTTLKNAILRGHLSHAYLFCGPRGVGKTTCARIFAKTINCLSPTANQEACGKCESCKSFAEGRSYSIHELDAASNNSVEDIRLLIEQVRIPPQIGKYSVYIIDEVHMLSSAAFNAFLKTLEEPPAHAIFILATTEKHKILPTILSRCQIYDFNRITIEDTVTHLKSIAEKEGVSYEEEAFNIIARKADGAMRDALSIFDRVVSFCGNNITYKAVIEDLNVLDYEYYFRLTDLFLEHKFADTYIIFDEILRKGFDALHFIAGLSIHFRDLLVCKNPQTVPLLEVGASIGQHYKEQAEKVPVEFLFEALNLSNQCEVGYRSSGNPRLHIELALLNICNIGLKKKNEDVISEDEDEDVEREDRLVTESHSVGNVTRKTDSELPPAPERISLKNVLSGKGVEKELEVGQKQEILLRNEFSQERLFEVWKQYANSIESRQPRLSSALQEYKPTLTDNFVIDYPTLSEKHKELLIERTKDLILFLRKELNNTIITINWTVAENEEGASAGKQRLYSPQDKLNFLIEKNPVLEELRKELDLDFR